MSQSQADVPPGTCFHLNLRIKGTDGVRPAHVYFCPDCHEAMEWWIMFNNHAESIQFLAKKLKEVEDRLDALRGI